MRSLVIKREQLRVYNFADISCFCWITITFLPVLRSLHSTLQSVIMVICAGLFLMGVLQKNRNLFLKFMVLIIISCSFNLYFYYQLMNFATTFTDFLNKSMRCWLFAMMGIYYFNYGTQDSKKAFLGYSTGLIAITAITTIIGNTIEPGISRGLGNGLPYNDTVFFYKINTANWGLIYGMAFSLPLWIDLFKKTKQAKYLGLLLLVFGAVLKSEITFALLLSVFFLFFFLVKPPRFRIVALIFTIILFLLVLSHTLVGEALISLENLLKNIDVPMLALRFGQLSSLFLGNGLAGTYLGRSKLYLASLSTFLNSPILGTKAQESMIYTSFGMHSLVFDALAATGIIGMGMCMGCFLYILLNTIPKIRELYSHRYMIISIVALILLALFNPIWYIPEVFMTTFLLRALANPLSKKN